MSFPTKERDVIEWLAEYGLFLAKTATLGIAIGIILALVAHGRRRGRGDSEARLKVTELDERFQRRSRQLSLAAVPKARRRQLAKQLGKATMPYLMIDGELLGGLDQLEAWLAEGRDG